MYHGTESLSNLGPRIWNLVSDKLKQLVDFRAFKKEIKKWKPKNSPFWLCKTYIPYVGFIQSFKFVLVFERHTVVAHQKLSYEGSFLRENALTWISSSAFTAYFLSAFSIGIFYFILFIYLFIFMYTKILKFLFQLLFKY